MRILLHKKSLSITASFFRHVVPRFFRFSPSPVRIEPFLTKSEHVWSYRAFRSNNDVGAVSINDSDGLVKAEYTVARRYLIGLNYNPRPDATGRSMVLR